MNFNIQTFVNKITYHFLIKRAFFLDLFKAINTIFTLNSRIETSKLYNRLTLQI